MATSPNYGWSEPDNTSLVKDGALAMRTLGDAIDTSVWNVGFGQAGKNKIINGNFGVNQRNFTSNTVHNTFNFDRWRQYNFGNTGTVTITPQTFTPGAAPVAGYEGRSFVQIVTASQSAATDYAAYAQPIEDVRTFAGQPATLSFWARATSGTPKMAFQFEQNFGSGGSSSVNTVGGTVTISTTWTRYSVTLTIPSISGKTVGSNSYLELQMWISGGASISSAQGIGNQNNTFQIWGVQLEYGSKATPFQTATGTIQGELAMCQRYYYLHASGNTAPIGLTTNYSSTLSIGWVSLPVTMRTTPSLAVATGTNFYVIDIAGGGPATNTLSIGAASNTSVRIDGTYSGLTAGQAGYLRTNNASAALAFSAEL